MPDFTLRAARADDAPMLARIHREARDTIPLTNALHTFEETTQYHAGLIANAVVWVAIDPAGQPIGYAAREEDILAQLYIAPAHHRTGLGAALLTMMRRESELRFWCFAHNDRALAFYRRYGAVEIGRELGPENEEGLPAIRFLIAKL